MASNAITKTVILKSSDGKKVVVPEAAARECRTIRHLIDLNCTQGTIPIPNVTGKILAKGMEYCKRHVDAADESLTETTDEGSSKQHDEELKKWDQKFFDVDPATLCDLILAANYLDIDKLLDAACQKMGDMMDGKSTEEIRQIFNLQDDFIP